MPIGTFTKKIQRRPGADGRVSGGRGTSIFQRLVDGPGEVISLTHALDSAAVDLTEPLLDLVSEDLPHLLAGIGYHPHGLPELREAIAEHFTPPTTPDQVVVTTGASQALALIAQMYLRKGASVVVESPSWPGCLDVFRAAGARLVCLPLDAEGIDAAQVARAFAEHRPALLYVTPTYNNPTGILMSAARRRRIAELAAQYDIPVVEDNAYNTALGPGEVPPPIAAYARAGAEILSVGSLTKTVWGGLRIGWVRAPTKVTERLARHKALADLGSPVLDQALAARLLPKLADLTADRAAVVRSRLDRLCELLTEHLPAWRWQTPAGGSALWTELPGGIDTAVFAQVALRHGVEVVPGSAMDPNGAHDSYIRIPFTFETDVLTELVHRLSQAWNDLNQ